MPIQRTRQTSGSALSVLPMRLRSTRALLGHALAEAVQPSRQWFNVEQAGDYLGLSEHAIRSMMRDGKLTSYQPNGPGTRPTLFSKAVLDAWVENGAR